MGLKLQEGSNEGLLIGKSNLNEQNLKSQLAERSFDLRTSGSLTQHASSAPLFDMVKGPDRTGQRYVVSLV